MTLRTGCTSRPNANFASTTEAAPAGYRQHSRRGNARALTNPGLWKNRTCLGTYQPRVEGTFPVKESARTARVMVPADGRGLVSQAGAVLLRETMRVTGLGRGLSTGLDRWRAPRAVHDPGKIVADLAAAVALGGTAWPISRCWGSSRSWPGRSRPTRWCPGWSALWPPTCRGR